jgi:hypothetical protein
MKTNTYLLLIHSKQHVINTITTISGESRHLLHQTKIRKTTKKQVGVFRKILTLKKQHELNHETHRFKVQKYTHSEKYSLSGDHSCAKTMLHVSTN